MLLVDYYMKALLYEPHHFAQREFAIVKNGQIIRHKTFPNVRKLRAWLIETSPEHVYFSSALYEYPDLFPMEEKYKYWLGADLVFDIDFDHQIIQTMDEARKQSQKLLLILKEDFGFQKILYADSGSRGFHVHVQDECIHSFTGPERRVITEYLELNIEHEGQLYRNRKYVGIDPQVTVDTTRLMRLPGSLNVKPDSRRPCSILQQ